jgi:predicted ester cyclase
MSQENKDLVRRMFEEADERQSVPAELFTPDCTVHIGGAPPRSLEAFQQHLAAFYRAFPDLSHTYEDFVAEGDRVALRVVLRGTHTGELMGIPATGRPIAVANIGIARIAGGRIAEWWASPDQLGLMQQIGAVPTPQQAGAA